MALHANNTAFLDLAKASFSGLQKDATHDLETRRNAIDGLIEPMLGMLKQVDVNSLSPIEALNKLFEWQRKYLKG